MNKLFLILIIIMILSCDSNVKKDLLSLCSEPIVITNKLVITYNGRDTVLNDVYDCKLKFIIYADSSDCTSCNINKMYMWDKLLKYAKLHNDKLKFYFLFNTNSSNIEMVRKIITLNPIDYPIFIDTTSDFEKSNPHLPKNKVLHTFLLDENNNVILVGNPLYNKEIEKLFYKKTQELLSK